MPSPLSALPALRTRVRLRARAGTLVRRLGLVPGGEPDGLGEDASVADLTLTQRVVAYFPEPPPNGYQLEQWIGPLSALDERHGVAIVTQDSRTTARIRARTGLPVLCVARTATLDALVARSSLGLALYVSHHPRNFHMLRHAGVAHVYVGHGESDKAVSASNQLKAYDRVFVAGPAAEERILAELMWFDRDRLVRVGRPQAATGGTRPLPEKPTVLYAPTWEGAQPSMAYSSVPTHGPALVRSLLEAGLRVVYRPHPRTGANRRDVADADARLREVFGTEAARRTGSVVETGAPIEAAFTGADLLVTDVSSVAVEWLPTGRPLVVTVPAEAGAVVAASPLLDAVPRLTAEHAADAGRLAWRCLREDPERAGRLALLEHYLGGLDAAAARDRFVQACGEVLDDRDRARAELPQGRR